MTTHKIDSMQDFEDAFGRAVASGLTQSVDALPHDISERLKVARMQALSKRKVSQVQVQTAAAGVVSGGTVALHSGGDGHRLWNWLGSLVPLALLVVGLVAIDLAQDVLRAHDIAEVDTELLTNDLPTAAYTDPGFAQYLRAVHQSE